MIARPNSPESKLNMFSKREFWPKIPRLKDEDPNKKNPGRTSLLPQKNLQPRSSIGRTCISITNYEASCSSPISSWMLVNNMTKLKKAYKFLTPIIDDIISSATNYSHREFKELLTKRQPICSISYTQYIRAYQASEIISQVEKELKTVHASSPYQRNFTVHNVATIKREELLENIERMADRIFIDRDLMKQLVDLHEMITDTIKKLKTSLDQVSIEGMPRENTESFSHLSLQSKQSIFIDKNLIRTEIADNFIVVGEPKNRCCMFESKASLQIKPVATSQLFFDMADMGIEEKPEHSTFLAQTDLPPPPPSPTDSLDNTYKHKSFRNSVARKSMESSVISKEKKRKSSSVSKRGSTVTSIAMEAPSEKPPRKISKKKQSKQEKETVKIIRNERCPDVRCTAGIEPGRISTREFEALVDKRASYTVGIREYQLKCNESIGEACAVLPAEFQFEERPSQTVTTTFNDNNMDTSVSRVPVIAESDTDENEENEEENEENYVREFKPSSTEERSPSMKVFRPTSKVETCNEGCVFQGGGQPCTEDLELCRAMFQQISEKIQIMKEDGFVNMQSYEYLQSEYTGVNEEYHIMQDVLQCLQELEDIKDKLYKLNFGEFEAEIPDPVGCCYREHLHVHTKVIGIPIAVNISQELWAMLSEKFGGRKKSVAVAQGSAQHPIGTGVKACECKPMTLKHFLREKCALAKILASRNEISEKNKVVMLSVDIDPLFEELFHVSPIGSMMSTAFRERELDMFEVMGMQQDSNTSLPYAVNRQSLPNVNPCSAMDIGLVDMREYVYDENIKHPKPRIQRKLQEVGLDNLLRSSVPAKCCRKAVINGRRKSFQPYNASLKSLPLTTSDLQLINEFAEEHQFQEMICNYHLTSATIRFKFECYTNFQENFASNYDYFVPKAPLVYQIFYFEIFKNNNNTKNNMQSESYMNTDVPSTHDSQNSTEHRHYSRHRQPQPHYSRAYPQVYPTRTQQNQSRERERERPRSVMAEFFRRFIFSFDQPSDYRMPQTEYSSESESTSHRRKRSKKRQSRSRSKRSKRKPRETIETIQQTEKKQKNRRLQACAAELDRFMQQEPTIFEIPDEEEEMPAPEDAFKYTISSSMKNYTVSRANCPKGNKDAKAKPLSQKETKVRTKTPKGPPAGSATIQHVPSNRKKLEGAKKPAQHFRTHSLRDLRDPDESGSDNLLSPVNYAESKRSYNFGQSEGGKFHSTSNNNNRAELKSSERLRSKESSPTNLGTIYETEERTTTSKESKKSSRYSTFYEFLRSPELTKSFQKFINSEEALNTFEENDVAPEEFWHMYFKSRRDARRKSSNTMSITSAKGMELRKGSNIDGKFKKAKPSTSRIPKRILVPCSTSESGSEASLAGSKSAIRAHTKPIAASVSQPTPTRTSSRSKPSIISLQIKPDSQLKSGGTSKEKRSKATIYFTDVLDETEPKNDGISLHTLKVLARKTGPGYIAVIHPVCGCPEVTVFVPCYCDDPHWKPRRPVTPRDLTRLTGHNRDGRHVIMPATCRVPLKKTNRGASTSTSRNQGRGTEQRCYYSYE